MPTLTRALSMSHDPADWLILADYYEERGDEEKKDEWKERARVGDVVVGLLVPLAPQLARGRGRNRWFGTTVHLVANRTDHTVIATIHRGVKLAEVRIYPPYLAMCYRSKDELSFSGGEPPEWAKRHMARAIGKLVDAIILGKE